MSVHRISHTMRAETLRGLMPRYRVRHITIRRPRPDDLRSIRSARVPYRSATLVLVRLWLIARWLGRTARARYYREQWRILRP